jgi:hypothetical protein
VTAETEIESLLHELAPQTVVRLVRRFVGVNGTRPGTSQRRPGPMARTERAPPGLRCPASADTAARACQ